MTTIHANSSRDCLTRLESLILASGSASVELPLVALRRQIASAVQVIVQLKRNKGGQRVILEIVEVTGMEQAMITTQSIFMRDKKKPGDTDQLLALGLVPSFLPRLQDAGIQLPPNFFDPNTKVTYQAD